jgi:hypothetical protein
MGSVFLDRIVLFWVKEGKGVNHSAYIKEE